MTGKGHETVRSSVDTDSEALEARLKRNAFKRRMIAGSAAVAFLSVPGLVGNLFDHDTGITADANLDEAHIDATVKKVVIEPEDSFHFATEYSTLEMDAQNVKYEIVAQPHVPHTPSWAHGPDVIPDPRVNKQMVGSAQESIEIPAEAIKQKVNTTENKIDITVDPSKFTGTLAWSGAGPEIKDYTMDDGKKNFQDRSGFRHSLNSSIGSNLKMLNIDTLSNTIQDLDTNVEHDMKLKGLDLLSQCDTKKEDEIQSMAKKAILDSRLFAPHADEIGTVTFAKKPFNIDVDTGEKAAKVLGDKYEHEYKLSAGNYSVDSLECFVDKTSEKNNGGTE